MKKILIVSFDFSKQGGIEYLAQMVYRSLADRYLVNTIAKKEKSKIKRLYKDINIIINLQISNIVIFMHPFLFRRYEKFIPANVKSIVWTHGREVFGNWGKYKTPNLSLANQIIAVSNYTKEKVLENWPQANVKVIHNSIPVSRYEESAQNLSRKKDLIIVSRMASDVVYKGHEIIFDALSLLRNLNFPYFPILHVVGNGNDKKRLENVVESLGLSDQVLFHGYITEDYLEKLYSSSLIFVMPSFVKKSDDEKWGGEGFGLVYLEAGLHQLPVIACDEGGQTDCIVDGKTGFLIKPEAKELAHKIEFLLSNPNLAHKMGEAGYYHVLNHFNFDRFKEDVLQLIESL